MSASGNNIRLRGSARTSIGQVRENNEDSIHLWTGESFVLAVVADGMGGAAAGEEASRIAVEAIQSGMALRDAAGYAGLEQVTDDALVHKLRRSIHKANLSIMQRAAEDPEMRGMGTTITLAFVRETEVIIAHVGDSRAYLVRGSNHSIRQITSDHSFVEALLAAGHITREQADEHPMRNVLYRALGQAEELDVDVYNTLLQVGDQLVLCSDGLTRHVKPEEISKTALVNDNPEISSQKLIDLANERGGEDNVSVIVIKVEQDISTTPFKEEALYTLDTDDEDTLMLKDRQQVLKKMREDQNQIEHRSGEADQPQAVGLNKHKMQAERLSDGDDNLDERADTPVYGIASRREGDGEGCDTLMPDQ